MGTMHYATTWAQVGHLDQGVACTVPGSGALHALAKGSLHRLMNADFFQSTIQACLHHWLSRSSAPSSLCICRPFKPSLFLAESPNRYRAVREQTMSTSAPPGQGGGHNTRCSFQPDAFTKRIGRT